MIYTVTLNPSIDYHVWIPALEAGTIQQAEKEWKDAGGKGINVSKVLRNLGLDSVALGFAGGFTGAFITQQLERQGITHRLIPIPYDTRINLKIKGQSETDISGVSPEIPPAAMDQLYEQLDLLTSEDILVLAGSVPRSLPEDLYQQIMQRLKPRKVRIFLDAKGKALARGIRAEPFLIKPNHLELGELYGVTIESLEEAVHYGRRAQAEGAQHVLVSMGGAGAVLVTREAAWMARIPPREPVNTIGAGDSMVAGFLYALTKELELPEALRFAVAAGSATALSEGLCTRETIELFLPEVSIDRMGREG